MNRVSSSFFKWLRATVYHRRFVAAGAALLVVSLCSSAARAQSGGTWDFDDNSGSQTYFDSTENFVGSTSRDYPELTLRSAASMQATPPTSTSGTCYAIQDVPVASNGTSTGYVKSKGTMRAVGYWTPPNATATPPATVTVLLTPQSWVTYQPSGANQPLTLSGLAVDNGFGDAPVYTFYSVINTRRWMSSGKHLMTLDATGGSWEYTAYYGKRWKLRLPLSLTASASIRASGSGFNPEHSRSATLNAFAGSLLVTPFTASLGGHSTADTANWDASNPRFFSGTNCKANGVAKPVSGYVSHAQLFVGGAGVCDYWDASIAPPAASRPWYSSVGTNQISVPLNAAFDSTRFADGYSVLLLLKVWDTAGNNYIAQCWANARNNAIVLINNDPYWSKSLSSQPKSLLFRRPFVTSSARSSFISIVIMTVVP